MSAAPSPALLVLDVNETLTDLRPLAGELVARAAAGPVALLFGPEDNGLDAAALDRCDAVLCLPADPAYPSLNLAQAAMLALYELRMAAAAPLPRVQAREPATAGERERFAAALAAAVDAVGFVKSGDGAATLRRLRALVARARERIPSMHPDDQEEAVGLIEDIESALNAGNADALASAAKAMSEFLFFVEGR